MLGKKILSSHILYEQVFIHIFQTWKALKIKEKREMNSLTENWLFRIIWELFYENDDSFLFLLKRHTPEKKDKEVFTDGKNDFSAEKAPAREGSRFSCENELGRREKGSRSKKS